MRKLDGRKIIAEWGEWTMQVVSDLGVGDIPAAANMLVCCLEEPRCFADIVCQKRMFTQPLVLLHHRQLWPILSDEEHLVQVYLGQVRDLLRSYGWQI